MARDQERKHWWFELKSDDREVFIYRENGPISHKGKELKDVTGVSHSEKVEDKVKVRKPYLAGFLNSSHLQELMFQ